MTALQDEYVERVKAELAALGYVVLKEKSYLAAQERQRVAKIRQEDAEERVTDLDRWARADLIPNERHMRNRLNFVYGIAVAHGATPEELRGFECGCGLSSCTVGQPLPPEVTERPRCPSVFPPSADAPHDGPGWSAPLRCVLSPHDHDRHLNNGLAWFGGMPDVVTPSRTDKQPDPDAARHLPPTRMGRAVADTTWVCPQCGGDAYLCNKSDHGAASGPALHCRERPTHNEFDPAEFDRWARLVTPSRTDKQPPASPVETKGGLGAVAPGTTNHPDSVTHHDTETAP